MEEGDVFRIFVPLKTDENGNVNKYKLTERQQAILDLIRNNSKIQTEGIEKELGISRSTAQREIQEIKKKVTLNYNKKTSSWDLVE